MVLLSPQGLRPGAKPNQSRIHKRLDATDLVAQRFCRSPRGLKVLSTILFSKRTTLSCLVPSSRVSTNDIAANFVLLYPATQKGEGIMLYNPNRLSVRPSVSASFPISNFSIFDRFSSNFAWILISGTSGLGLHMG